MSPAGSPPFSVHPEGARVPAEVERLAAQVVEDGGAVLAAYREPVGGRWQMFALLPRERVAPTPYQRDLSKAHAERLFKVIKKLDRFVDPVVAVHAPDGYWTPNGHHRLRVLEKLKAEFVPAILVPDPEVAFQILALNTEKAHNLKDKSLEVIRMYRGLLEEGDRRHEDAFAFQFEEPHFVTFGLLYEKNARFAGGAYAPIVRRVDGFMDRSLKSAFEVREERAARVAEADDHVKKIVEKLKRRGIRHPFVKNFVLSRCNPLYRIRTGKSKPGFDATMRRLIDALDAFDVDRVRHDEIARSAVYAAPAAS